MRGNPETTVERPLGAPVLMLLIALLLLASAQRLLFPLRRPTPVLRGEPPVVAADQRLQLRPLANAPEGVLYQVAALVRHLEPGAVLRNRHLIRETGGTVALGRTVRGEAALQTCLMATGRSAVTQMEISREIRASAPRGRLHALRRYVNNLLFTTPMRRRECLLVLLRTNAPVPSNGTLSAEAQLLESWRGLQPQLVPVWR